MWKRIVAEEKVADVFGSGTVRLGGGASSSASVIGIRFDEKSVKTAAIEHSRDRQAPVTESKSVPAAPVQDVIRGPIAPVVATAPVEDQIKPPRRVLAADAVGVSVDDAADVLGMSRGTVYKLIDAGKLVSKKIGGRRLVSAESVRALLR